MKHPDISTLNKICKFLIGAIMLVLISLLCFNPAGAQTAPTVIFAGDELTYNWSQSPSFLANSNWTSVAVSGIPYGPGQNNYESGTALSEFQAAVINKRPTFVFIETGTSDLAWQSDSTPYGLDWELSAEDIVQMVQMAQQVGIKVILGNIVTTGFQSDHYNNWLQTFAQAKNVPLVNFQGPLVNGFYMGYYTSQWQSLITATDSPFPMFITTDAGSQLMTKLAQDAIATYGLKIKGGWLSNTYVVDGLNDEAPPNAPNVNQVNSGGGVQFTPHATWSDGVNRPMMNCPYRGSLGIWWSSNPKVMDVDQHGLAYAYTAGTATIWFRSASGSTFSPWIMNVNGQFGPSGTLPLY